MLISLIYTFFYLAPKALLIAAAVLPAVPAQVVPVPPARVLDDGHW